MSAHLTRAVPGECLVCHAYAHSVPMTARTTGVELYLCDDAVSCQASAAANAVEAMGLIATTEPAHEEVYGWVDENDQPICVICGHPYADAVHSPGGGRREGGEE